MIQDPVTAAPMFCFSVRDSPRLDLRPRARQEGWCILR